MAAEVDKKLLALLNGLSRRHFFKEERFTDEFLREEVLDNLSEEGKSLYCDIRVDWGGGYIIILIYICIYAVKTIQAFSYCYSLSSCSRVHCTCKEIYGNNQ